MKKDDSNIFDRIMRGYINNELTDHVIVSDGDAVEFISGYYRRSDIERLSSTTYRFQNITVEVQAIQLNG